MARTKTITPDQLAEELNKILDQYGDDITDHTREAVRAAAKKGTQALKTVSKATFGTVKEQKRKYADSWTVKHEDNGLYELAILYNNKPGLPHLLEHGHALKGGGRSGHVEGRQHIKPVEEELVNSFEKALREAIAKS